MPQTVDTNRRVVLSERPNGLPDAKTLQLEHGEVPTPGAGQVLLRQAVLARAAGRADGLLEEELIDAFGRILADPSLSEASRSALMALPRWQSADLSSLRMISTGSTIVSEAFVRKVSARGVPVIQVYGSTEVRTPHMAKLAADGLKFTHAFVASPACGPSRTALFSGIHCQRGAGRDSWHRQAQPRPDKRHAHSQYSKGLEAGDNRGAK